MNLSNGEERRDGGMDLPSMKPSFTEVDRRVDTAC